MRKVLLLAALTLSITATHHTQSVHLRAGSADASEAKSLLNADLQALDAESLKLDAPVARALAKAEIADAAWAVDEAWAKKLLREAYELTLPSEEEQFRLRNRPLGAPLSPPGRDEIARNMIRRRVLEVAGRDRAFAAQLAQLNAQHLGREAEHETYASFATRSLEANDLEAASNYIIRAIEADPTLITAMMIINELAAKDRRVADQLILRYIERLRTTPISLANHSFLRTSLILSALVFDSNSPVLRTMNRNLNSEAPRVPPPGAAVVRAYVSYVIETIKGLEQREPGSLRRARGLLLSVWLPLNQHSPELIPDFVGLEQSSRRPGETFTPPQANVPDERESVYNERVKKAIDSRNPDDMTIEFALSRKDFARARRMLEMLPDDSRKPQFFEKVNMLEALSLAANGELGEAEILASRLTKAVSMLQVYPPIINKWLAKKDRARAVTAAYQALAQIRRADATPFAPPQGLPSSVAPTSRDYDPVLTSLSKLAIAIAPADKGLAFEMLDETIEAANRSQIDTGAGRTGFDAEVFRTLAAKDEERALMSANSLRDRLMRNVALAAIYQWKAKELTANAEGKNRPRPPSP